MPTNKRFAQYPSLRDAAVLITGGASGIGAAMVESCALQGSRVAFLDMDDKSASNLVQQLQTEVLHSPYFVHCDLADVASLRDSVAKIEGEMGPVQVLVNNAASDDRHRFEDVTPEYWDQRMAVNLRHQFFSAQAVAAGMKSAGGGSIINMSSIAWMIPTPDLSTYNMAKAAIVAMTRSLAHDLGAANIRVNCVLPGAILTERQHRL